jgi:predicted ArsR family transcriptional regulator
MTKRKAYEVRKKILMALREKPLSYAQLERKINTGFRTIKRNCEELETYEILEIEKIDKDPANGKPSYRVKITNHGVKSLERLKRVSK